MTDNRPPPTSVPLGWSDPYGLGYRGPERRRKAPKGRKFQMTCAVLGLPFAVCSAALFMDKLTGGEYVTFLVTTIPLGLTAFHAANVMQKVGLAKAQAEAPHNDNL